MFQSDFLCVLNVTQIMNVGIVYVMLILGIVGRCIYMYMYNHE